MKEKNFFNLKDMVLMALFAALTCVLAPLAVPIGPVPISLTNLVIYFSLYGNHHVHCILAAWSGWTSGIFWI